MLWFKRYTSILAAASVLGAAAPAAVAAGLQISPTGLAIPAKQRAGVFTLTNTGGKPLTAQVRVYRWEQDAEGRDVLTPSRAVVASPPMVKLASGGAQQFRVVRTQPAGRTEEAYRLIVDELPATGSEPPKGLQFVLRYSVPVFLNQEDQPEAVLQWRAESLPGGKTRLSAKNTGTSYAQLSNIVWKNGGMERSLAGGLAGYALPGKTWRHIVDSPTSLLQKGRLSVTVNGRLVQPEVRFVSP